MPKKKSIGIILLLLFLIWGAFNTLFRIFIRTDSTDTLLWKNYNLLWLGYLFALIILVLNIASIVAIFKPQKWGLKVLYAFFILNVAITLLTLLLGVFNIDTLKDAVIQSRTSRGLSTEGIDSVVSPSVMTIISLLYVIFYILLTFYVYKRKDYFSS